MVIALSCSQTKAGVHAQTRHSHDAFLKPVGTLSHHLSETGKHVPTLYILHSLAKASNPHRACSLITWPSWSRGWRSWAPPRNGNRKDSSWQANPMNNHPYRPHPPPPLPALQIADQNRTQTSCEKDLFTLSGVSTWGTGFTFPTHLEAKEVSQRM